MVQLTILKIWAFAGAIPFGFGIGAFYLFTSYYLYPVFFRVLALQVVSSILRTLKAGLFGNKTAKVLPFYLISASFFEIFYEEGSGESKIWYGYELFPNVFPHIYARLVFILIGCIIFFKFYAYLEKWRDFKDAESQFFLAPFILLYAFSFSPIWYSSNPPRDVNVELLVGLDDFGLNALDLFQGILDLIQFTFCLGFFSFFTISLLMVPLLLVKQSDVEIYFTSPIAFMLVFAGSLFYFSFQSGEFVYHPEWLAYPEFVPHPNQYLIGLVLISILCFTIFNLFSLYGEQVYRQSSINYEVRSSLFYLFFLWGTSFIFMMFASSGQLESIFSFYALCSVKWPMTIAYFSNLYPYLSYSLLHSPDRITVTFSVFPITELSLLASVFFGTIYGYLSVPLKLNALVWDRRIFIFLNVLLLFFSFFTF